MFNTLAEMMHLGKPDFAFGMIFWAGQYSRRSGRPMISAMAS
jgi:hypothetical protein